MNTPAPATPSPGEHPVAEHDLRRAMHLLVLDGMCSHVMGVLTTGAFIAAFALLLGASNTVIGMIAAVGPLCQMIQVPAIALVQRTGHRRRLVVAMCIIGRGFWFVVAALPWIAPEPFRIPVLLLSLFAFFGTGAVANCAWNSWMRDLIPDGMLGAFFGKRMAFATALSAALSLAAGFGIDAWKEHFGDPMGAYAILFAVGGAAGIAGSLLLSITPEPAPHPNTGESLLALLRAPFRDANFRNLLHFTGSWNFAVNLAAPFFTVYMLKNLGLSMGMVLTFSVVSQAVNVIFFRVWGRLADRFTNKSVLTVAGPLFIYCFLIWPFTTMPGPHALTLPLLFLIHVLGGISTAGMGLCCGNIALRAAPYGRATAYLAVNALVAGAAAMSAPILGGLLADAFAAQQISISINWHGLADDGGALSAPMIDLEGLDFVFLIAFVLGLYAIHRLLAVRETGEVGESIIVTELYGEVRRIARHVSNVAGVRLITAFPFGILRSGRNRRPSE